MSILRFVTAGSVDDGKSTLIGRLLYDAQLVHEDVLEAVDAASRRGGLSFTDLSLITDGLIAEREQGITIDVAYRYFSTPSRKYIVADCPGHRQYTRNMVTGASNADCAVLLVDAQAGLLEQTRRHAAVCAWLGVPRLILVVNKMDRVAWSQQRFDAIADDFASWCAPMKLQQVSSIPASALEGDMVVNRGDNLDWYKGPSLLQALESAPSSRSRSDVPAGAVIAVQSVIRGDPRGKNAFRVYAGKVSGSKLDVGDTVRLLPAGQTAKIAHLYRGENSVESVDQGQSISLRLDRDLDISRGDVLVTNTQLQPSERMTSDIAWFSETPLKTGAQYTARIGTQSVKVQVDRVVGRLDLEGLRHEKAEQIECDDLAAIEFTMADPVTVLAKRSDSPLGRFILIDQQSGATVGAGLVQASA